MSKVKLCVGFLFFSSFISAMHAQTPPPIVVFWEEGFPAADTAAPSRAELVSVLPNARYASARELGEALGREESRLLVLPFGSAFPEESWEAIEAFLERGGNLLVLSGQPFTRPAYREDNIWRLRPPSLAFAKRLFINEYHLTPGSQGLQFQVNENFAFLNLPVFEWKRAFSLIIRLSDEDLYPRGGSAGSIDARLDALAWGTTHDRRVSSPIVQIDHLKNHFVGGRWIFLACELPRGFFASQNGQQLIPALAHQALEGAEAFVVRPSWPLFLPGEPLTFEVRWRRFGVSPTPASLALDVAPEVGPAKQWRFELAPGAFPYRTEFTLSLPSGKGLHVMTARLSARGALRGVYRTGFWLREEASLRSGPRVTVNKDLFEFDGQPQLVLGTTYMASDVQREFFMSPNPYVWDQDMAELRRAGFNMLRTGWWTAWDQVMKESGVVHEEMLRALEAFLMTAQKHRLPVQFTFFSFIPEILGGSNPYLDPEAVRRQKDLIIPVVERFKDVPFLMWDLINEPSFSNPNRLWSTRPNRDKYELRAWNTWLKERFRNRTSLAEAWRSVPLPDAEPVALPDEEEFSTRAMYRTSRGGNALKVHDYYRFSQEKFLRWVDELRGAIRGTGSRQLITVGQDEGGGRDRLSPAFFGDGVDFTTTHSWWQIDALLWDSLVAKQSGKPMLVQETGIQHELQIDESGRRTPEEEAILLERKVAMALATSAGAIQWLWHTNAYMRDDGEASIGAIRADRSEKPEVDVLLRFAPFVAASKSLLRTPQTPEVAIVTSQAFQYSALNWLALEAQMKAVRALHYYCRVPGYVVAENQLARLGNPRLVILPSPHALSEEAWQALLKYVAHGGNLFITGSVERDPHWQGTRRLSAFGLDATREPVIYRHAEIPLESKTISLSFDGQKQSFLEALRVSDGQALHTLPWGKGRVFLVSYPVELAEGLEPVAELYAWALRQVRVEPPFEGKLPSPGMLIWPVLFADSVLYLFASESAQEEEIAIKDKTTGAEIRLRLPAQRASLVLLGKKDGRVLAQYTPSPLLPARPAN